MANGKPEDSLSILFQKSFTLSAGNELRNGCGQADGTLRWKPNRKPSSVVQAFYSQTGAGQKVYLQ
jgi:hypothetical protein